MSTANTFAWRCRSRSALAWLLVCAAAASGSEHTRSLPDQTRQSEIEIVAADSAFQRVALRFEGDRRHRALAVGDAAVRGLRLISVRGDLALLEYVEPESKASVLLQVRQGAVARLRAVPKLATEATMVTRIPDEQHSGRAKSGAKPSSDSRASRQSSNAQ